MPKRKKKAPVPALVPVFQRAVLDRNMTIETAPLRKALDTVDLSGLAILDFGCGNGNLLRLLKNTKADTIYAFEVLPDDIDDDIKQWAADPAAKPRLVINPEEFRMGNDAPVGDLTNYDYKRLLAKHPEFAIISNPPYFLYNRILSLTGQNLTANDNTMKEIGEKFRGALMITSKTRLQNHPNWIVRSVMAATDFLPPAGNDQYLIQTGFTGRTLPFDRMPAITPGSAQLYPPINDRNPDTDYSDCYPEMWKQLDQLKP